MNLTQAIPVIESGIKNGINILLTGSPGLGKSDSIKEVANNCIWEKLKGGDDKPYDLMISHPVVSEPTDYKGLPSLVNGEAEFLAYGDLRAMLNAKRPLIVNFDDVGNSCNAVQASLMQISLERSICGHKISPFVKFVMCSNRRKDKTGVSGLISALINRYTILEIEADTNSWIKWALSHNVPIELIAFLRFKPTLINTFKAEPDIVNFASPRSITMLGEWIKANVIDLNVWRGCTGESFSVEFYAFYKTFKELAGLPDSIIQNPTKAEIPSNPATLYALCGALQYRSNQANFDNICTYGKRLAKEYMTALMCDCTSAKPELLETKAYIGWAVDNQKVI